MTQHSTYKQRSLRNADAADLSALSDAVDDIIRRTRAGTLNRTDRLSEIDALCTAFSDGTGDRVPEEELTRLTDAILHEELTDPNPHKVAHTEYPILSEIQLEARREGSRDSRSNMDGEVGYSEMCSEGADGKNHRLPTRRKRTARENWRVDMAAMERNRARSAQYKRDTSPGAVSTGVSESWRESRKILDRFAVTPEYYRQASS